MLVQYRLALYSILIDLINAMQACDLRSCRAVSASNNGLSHCFGGTLFFGSLNRQFLSDVEDSFTICGNSVVYQSAPVVDLCRRLFPVVTQFAPRRRSVRRTPAGFEPGF